MRFFEKFFGALDVVDTTGEANVLCPFPHIQSDGTEHLENIPSAHINPTKGTFHCKVPNCKSKKISPKGGLSEAGFLSAIQGVSYGEATRIILDMEGNVKKTEKWETWHDKLKQSLQPDSGSMLSVDLELIGLLDEKLIDDLRLGYKGGGILFPIFVYGEYMGSCEYYPFLDEEDIAAGKKKAKLEPGTSQGIFPFDLWRKDERDTFLCAGFKDAAMARLHGFNAITFTHGEGSFPKLYKRMFTGRKVYICYDNDEGGRDGARRTAMHLKEVGAYPFIVDISSVCAENKEDIHDFFYKYEKTADDLKNLAYSTPPFSEEDYEKERNVYHPLVTLQQSTSGSAVGKIVSSRVSVVADYSQTFRVPDVVKFEHAEGSVLEEGQEGMYTLEEENIQDILKLMDSNLKEADIYRNLKVMAGLPAKDPCIIRELSWTVVHKAVVVDDIESEILDAMDEAYSPLEMLVYSLGDDNKLSNGNKYRIFYKSVTHPYKAREIVGVITKLETSDTSVNAFKVTEDVLESVKCFQVQEGETVEKKMEELYERSKAFLGPEANKPVFNATELFFHTPLEFMLSNGRKERAYLEPMIVGESRTHKSATSKGMIQIYGLGTFVSLKNSTEAGLIGGSQGSANGGYKTRLGVIPRNHKGAVVLEEFSGAPQEFIKKMTDIRSSNMVRIARVSGTTTAPAMVRMLTLSNVKAGQSGTTIPLKQYPHGVKILQELIGLTEDINRYDFFVLKDEGEMISPDTEVTTEAFNQESYQNRIRWIWSRKPDQVVLEKEVFSLIQEANVALTKKYGTHIQFFGREGWKKISRVAIAVAACVCSYDETGQKLVVTHEHVQWASKFLVSCYDNPVFNMKHYVQEERSYNTCDKNDVLLLQGIYDRNPALIMHMFNGTEFSQQQLRSVSGEKDQEYGKLINQLARSKFIKWSGDKVQPSPKFREAMGHIDFAGTSLQRV